MDYSESLDKYRVASTRCTPPLESDELNTLWKSALKYYKVIKSQKDYIPPEQYKNTSWDELIPLDEVALPVFPIYPLPDVLKNYVSDIGKSTQTPIDMAGGCFSCLMLIAMQPKYKGL